MAEQPAPMASPQAAPEEQSAGPGPATQLIANIHSELTKLMDILDKSEAVTDQDKQGLSQIISAYQGFVEGLGSEQQAPPQKQGPSMSPPNGGPGTSPAMSY